jgi:RNA polymerase sigma factor (sigma-70 family)
MGISIEFLVIKRYASKCTNHLLKPYVHQKTRRLLVKAQHLLKETIPNASMSDGLLAQLVLSGDQRAFEILLRRYSTALFSFIYRFLGDYDLACDTLQQVSLRFYTSLSRLSTDDAFKPWLFQVARNCCIDELRRKRRYALPFSQLETENSDGETSALGDIIDPRPSPEDQILYLDLQQSLQECILTLPPKFRAVVTLRYVSQFSFVEIGKILGIPEATAKTYFYRAKLILRRMLNKEVQIVSA